MAGQDGEGAVDLFGEDYAGEFVGHGQRRKRDALVGQGAEFDGETFGVAAEEDDFAGGMVAEAAEPARELLRAELIAGGVEQDEGGAGLHFQFAQSGGGGFADFGDGDFGVAADAFDVVVDESAELFAAGFSEHYEADFHA